MKAETVAKYFLNKDTDEKLFNDNLVTINGHTSYEGNIRLNKLLHIAQLLFIAKYEKLLFDDDLFAFENGGVVDNVRTQYVTIKQNKNKYCEEIPDTIGIFLGKVFDLFKNSSISDLMHISHEDIEWKEKNKYNTKYEQKMNCLANIKEYKTKFSDLLSVMFLSEGSVDDQLGSLIKKYYGLGLVQDKYDECGRFVLSAEELDDWK